MLYFDSKGHLTPYTCIRTDWATFEATFGWNKHRVMLIRLLERFVNSLKATSINTFDLWVDGSFVSRKVHPEDIDVVLFLPTIDHRTHQKLISTLRDEYKVLDLYIVRKIDETERDYFLYLSDRTEWLFQFTTTRPDKTSRQKHPKGFLEISWYNE